MYSFPEYCIGNRCIRYFSVVKLQPIYKNIYRFKTFLVVARNPNLKNFYENV